MTLKLSYPNPITLKIFIFFGITLLSSNFLFAQTVVQTIIGNVSGPSSFSYGPIYRNNGNAGLLNYSRHAYLYTAADLNIPSGSKIIKLEWLKKDTARILGNNNFNVWISNTTATSYASQVAWSSLSSGVTQAFSSSSYSISTGANTYIAAPFIDSFTYNGGGIQILTDWAKLGFATAAIPFYTVGSSGKTIGIASTTPLSSTTLLQASTYGNFRPTLRITYVTVPSCAGIPNPGNTISSANDICPGVLFTLSLQNLIPGGQVTYQWQQADDAGFTINTINLGTGSQQNISQTEAHYYRCLVTCGAGPSTNSSTPILVSMSPKYACYPASQALSDADEDIVKFTFGGFRNCSDCSMTAGGIGSIKNRYGNYQYLTPTAIQQGASIPFSIEVGICGVGFYTNACAIFIDYNQNSSFEDPGEFVYSSPGLTNGGHIESGMIQIPTNAVLGVTGMRVINIEKNSLIDTSAGTYSWGETEDYLVEIQSGSTCSGTPNPGNTITELPSSCASFSGNYSICSGKSVSLTLQNILPNTDIGYQWYNSNGIINGATQALYITPPIVANDSYYCTVTCNSSGLSTNSSILNITLSPFIDCYCNSGAGQIDDEDIFSFTLNGQTNTSSCLVVAPGAGSILNKYSNFSPLGNFATLNLGGTYAFSVDVDDCDIPPLPFYAFGTAIWIDFNHNGSFSDIGEKVFVEATSLNGPRTVSGNISIPCSALEGPTKLRLTAAEGLGGNNLTPCLAYGFGETEDYIINLVHPSICTQPVPNPGLTLSDISIFCDSASVKLRLENECLLSNYTFQWYKNNIAIAGATSYIYQTPMLYETATFRCEVTCGSSTASSIQKIITRPLFTVTLNSSNNTYCSPGGNPITLTPSGSLNYSYQPSFGLSNTTGSFTIATPSTSTTYTVIGTDANGCTRSSTSLINVIPCSVNFSLKLFIQGYYSGVGLMTSTLKNQGIGSSNILCDSVIVELHEASAPFALVDFKKLPILTNGTVITTFPSLTIPYYIAVKHRNGLETWSATPVAASTLSYDFTSNASKAYGNNLIEVGANIWAIYSGDLVIDQNIDLLDLGDLEDGVFQFLNGYQNFDLNGDGNVDLLDVSVIQPNVEDFIYSQTPY